MFDEALEHKQTKAEPQAMFLIVNKDCSWNSVDEKYFHAALETHRLKVYLEPPQTKEVKDALEEAAKICVAEGNEWDSDNKAVIEQMREALKKADEFITNGIEYGYIHMPDLDTPDTAKQTPIIVKQALALPTPSEKA